MDEGKEKVKKKNESVNGNTEIAAASVTISKEFTIVGKTETKDVQNTKEIQSPEKMLHFGTKSTDYSGGLTLAEDTKAIEKSSHRQELFMSDQDTMKMLDAIEATVDTFNYTSTCPEYKVGNISVTEYRGNSIFDQSLCCWLKLSCPEFFENAARLIDLNEKNVDRLWNIFYSKGKMPETANTSKKYQVLKAIKTVNETIPEDKFKQDLRKFENMAVDDIPKPMHLPQELTMQNKCKKKGKAFTGKIQDQHKCRQNTESEWEEAEKYFLDDEDERKGREKDSFEMKQMKEETNNRPSKLKEISKQEKLGKLYKCTDLTGKYLDTFRKIQRRLSITKGKRDANCEGKDGREGKDAKESALVNAAKEAAAKANDLIMQWKKEEEYKKENESGSSTDNKVAAGNFLLNTMENKNEKEKDKENVEKCKKGIPGSRFKGSKISKKQGIAGIIRKCYTDLNRRYENSRTLPVGGFNPDTKGITSQKKSWSDEQENKTELKSMEEKRNIFSFGTYLKASVAKTESHKKTKDTTDVKSDDLQEVVVPAESYKPDDPVDKTKDTIVVKSDDLQEAVVPAESYKPDDPVVKTKDTTDVKSDDLQEVVVPAKSYKPDDPVADLKPTEKVHFSFDTDGNMPISVGKKRYMLKENQDVTFNCEEENVQISFKSSQIFISTPNRELDISIQKSDPVSFTAASTQTDNL